jgi:hypothetical protein
MAEKLVVWGCNSTGPDGTQWRMVAAVKSRAEFSRLLKTSDRYVKAYGSETGNATEIAAAMAKPHTLFGKHTEGRWDTRVKEFQEIGEASR